MTAGRAALIELMRRYLNGLLDPSITLLEVHKLDVLYAGARGTIEIEICQGTLWALRGEFTPCFQCKLKAILFLAMQMAAMRRIKS